MSRYSASASDYNHILSQVELANLLGVSVTTVQRMRRDPGFPKRKRIADGTKGWIKGEVLEWLLTCPAA